jgi:hypothetical protein
MLPSSAIAKRDCNWPIIIHGTRRSSAPSSSIDRIKLSASKARLRRASHGNHGHRRRTRSAIIAGSRSGNVTGVTSLLLMVGSKRLELLHELVPTASVIALLVNPANPTVAEANSKELQVAARALGLELHILNASTERDFDEV